MPCLVKDRNALPTVADSQLTCYIQCMPKSTARVLPSSRRLAVIVTIAVTMVGSAFAQNGAFQEIFSGISGSTVASLTNATAFPNSPSSTNVLTSFEAAQNSADNYGQRVRALMVAPTTGAYVFWIASDDNSVLYLSTDESAFNKVPIATVNSSTTSRQWTKEANQQSTNINLEANRRYYVEALQKDGSGNDNLAVRWRLPNGTIEEPIGSSRLRVFGMPATIAPTINLQPASTSVVENTTVKFRVGVTNVDAVSYQWQRAGTNLPNARGATYTLAAALADHGAAFQCLITNTLGASTSASATLSVTADTTRPALASAANVNTNTLVVVFSEPLETATATNKTNYVLSGGATIATAAFGATPNTITLGTSPLTFGTDYTLTVNNVRDRAATPNAITAGSAITFPALFKGIYREIWTNLGGNHVFDLTNHAAYPASPNSAELMTNFVETTSNSADSFGQRLRAMILPPVTGSYTFWIAADEEGVLLLGTNASPTSARVIATSLAAPPRSWDSATSQRSAAITLTGGQAYHFEVLAKEGVNTDNLALRWQLPDGSIEEPISALRLTPVGMFPPLITQAPASVVVVEGAAAGFTVAEGNSDPIAFQWQRNGANLSGATNAAYTLAVATLADHAATFRCVLWNPLGAVTSTIATLTVNADATRPMLAGALNQGATNVVVFFSELVEAATATNHLNYSLSSGVIVSAATLRTDNRSVLLVSTPLVIGSNYAVTVNNVRDRAATPNTILPGSLTAFTAIEFFPQDIGGLPTVSVVTPVPGGVNVTAGGLDIGGTNDQFSFSFQLRTGDFDVKARVARLDFADTWSEASLMAREDLTPGSRFVGAVATPTLAGSFMTWRTNVAGTAVNAGAFPVNPGNAWLRLARAGSVFTGFASLDGALWTQLGVVTSALPATVHLGFGVASHSTSLTTVWIRDFMEVTNATLETPTPVTEPPGPCSRRTALAITEIMYHPAERADGRSGEFVELFNSNPFPEDISGYRVSGDISYTFPPGTTIRGGEHLVVARNVADFQAIYPGTSIVVFGPYSNNLPNTAGTLRLRNNRDAVLLEINYDSRTAWPAAADGAGHSLVLARPSWGEGSAQAWAPSDVIGGSPGTAEGTPFEPQRHVLINEFLAHTDLPDLDYVELYNHSAVPVDLSGCWLSDDPATNKFRIPDGTTLGATGFVAFTQTTLGFSLSAAGETIYLVNSNRTRVLNAVRFDGQENGVASGRVPDGAAGFLRLANKTPGAPNGPPRADAVVINEIMFSPVSGRDEDEFVELHNRSAAPVDLSGWRFTDGVDFTFGTNVILSAGGYLVVARSVTNLLAKYPNLTTANCLGDFDGSLRNSGERLALAKPDANVTTNGLGQAQTNIFSIVMDEVAYASGGRWGQWSSAGGSSLELIDPRADNRLPSNWANSDDTAHNLWTTVSATGTLDNSAYTNWNSLQLWMQDAGEALVDDVFVSVAGSANMVTNPGFESGLADWFAQGSQLRSSLASTGYNSSAALHLRASSRGDTGANRVRTTLSGFYSNNVTGTISAKVKWLHGRPEILFRLRGNHLEAPGQLLVPPDLGTPGARNSRYQTNAGPAIAEVAHAPVLPWAGKDVTVTARVSDPDGLAAVQLTWRVDPGGSTNVASMRDDGAGGDAVAGDGVFTATIAGQTNGAVVAFAVSAEDNFTPPAAARFPEAAARECLVRFGETQPVMTIGAFRFWMTLQTFMTWTNRLERLSNEPFDGTFVLGNFRVIYGAGARYAGSPFHSPAYTSPIGGNCDYQISLPADDAHLAETEFTLQLPGNGGGDGTGQGQQTAYWIARELGIPFNHHRYVNMFMHGVRRGVVMEDVQQPSGDHEQQWWPEVDDGSLHKVQLWFEHNDTSFSPFGSTGASLSRFTTTGGSKKLARYRQNWGKRAVRTGESVSDYTALLQLVDALATTNSPVDGYLAVVEPVVDFDVCSRVFAVQRIIGNGDSYGNGGGQNMYIFKAGATGRWNLLLWDIDFAFSSGAPTANLFNFTDSPITTLFNIPVVRRTYWQALEDAANGPLLPAKAYPLIDAKYDALRASGLNASAPTTIKSYIATRRDHILALLSTVRSELAITNNGGASFTNASTVLTLGGLAPISARSLTANGIAYPVSWSTISNWSITLTLAGPTNEFTLEARDAAGIVLPGATRSVTVYFNGPVATPEDALVINEIKFNSAASNTAYVEIFNRSTNTSFSLGGYRLRGLDFDFNSGTIIAPRGFVVVAQDTAAFQAAYGTNLPLAGEFGGTLDRDGETLTLVRTVGTNEFLVNKVKYEITPPWPVMTDATDGFALQLVDAAQDNARAGNWSDGTGWRLLSATATNLSNGRIRVLLDGAGDVHVDDVSLVAGTVAGSGPNLIANGGFESPLAGGAWLFGTNVSNSVISATVKRSGTGSLRLVSTTPGNPNVPAATPNCLYQNLNITTGGTYTVSLWYLPSTNANKLTAYFATVFRPDAIVKPAAASPGASNIVAGKVATYPHLWINEVLPDNPDGLRDNTGTPQPWIELFNSGSNLITLDGFFLANDYSNLNQWPFPADALIGPGEFLTVFADGQPQLSTGAVLHTSFRLDPVNGTVALARGDQLLDYINYGGLSPGLSVGAWPDGQLFDRQRFHYVTPGASNNPAPVPVAINEWMASNTRTLANPGNANRYDDWFELFNFGTTAINLSGYFLTDDLGGNDRWRIPDGTTIPARGFLLVWADNNAPGTNGMDAALHAGFQLRRSGDEIGLYDPAGLLVDAVTFPTQTSDVSQGRYADGNFAGVFHFMTNATPGTTNLIGGNLHTPALATITNFTLDEGTLLTFTNTATDADTPAQMLTFSLAAGAPFGASVHPTTGVFTWVPVELQGGITHSITVQVSDNGQPARADTRTFTVTVNKVNSPPAIAALETQTVDEETALAVQLTATDTDLPAQSLSLTLLSAPMGASLDASGLFTWTPGEADGPGTNTIVVAVSDNASPALSFTQSFVVVVSEVNRAPELPPIAGWTLHQGTTLRFTNTATDADLPANQIHYTLNDAPAGASIAADTGVFAWTPSEAQADTTKTLTITATDNGSPVLTAAHNFTVLVVARPRLTASLSGAGVTLAWTAVPGVKYRVQFAAAPDALEWADLTEDLTATGPTATVMDSPLIPTQRFYRVAVQ